MSHIGYLHASASNVSAYLGVSYRRAWDVVVCLDKSSWADERTARAAAAAHGLRAYRCPVCGRWHLSSRKEERK